MSHIFSITHHRNIRNCVKCLQEQESLILYLGADAEYYFPSLESHHCFIYGTCSLSLALAPYSICMHFFCRLMPQNVTALSESSCYHISLEFKIRAPPRKSNCLSWWLMGHVIIIPQRCRGSWFSSVLKRSAIPPEQSLSHEDRSKAGSNYCIRGGKGQLHFILVLIHLPQ